MPIANPIPRFYRNRYSEAVGSGAPTMKIGIHAPSKPAVVVSLLLAILALIGYFVDSSFAFLSRCLHTSLEHSASWWKSESEADFVVAGP